MDEIRGFLIIGVVISHTLFDMHYFFSMDMSWIKSPLFTAISDIGAIIFILISGMVSEFSRDNINRGLKLMCVAATVTLVTHIVVPDYVVYAGILHLLSFAIVLHELIKPLLVKINRIAGLVINILIALLTANLYGREISILGLPYLKYRIIS